MGSIKLSSREVGIIIFAKNYEVIDVKTRLSKDLSKEIVKEFYKACIEDVISTVRKVNSKFFLYWYPEINYSYPSGYIQKGNDLGERMYNAFIKLFESDYNRLILIGTDIPHINEAILIEAIVSLNNFDYVIGKAKDGGYYLIGTKKDKIDFKVFENIPWSTRVVFDKTIKNFEKLNYSYKILGELYDLDTYNDLVKFYKEYKDSDLKCVKILINENFCNYSSVP